MKMAGCSLMLLGVLSDLESGSGADSSGVVTGLAAEEYGSVGRAGDSASGSGVCSSNVATRLADVGHRLSGALVE